MLDAMNDETNTAIVSALGGECRSHLFDAKGKRLGVFMIAYNAEKHISDTLNRIPEEVWQAVEVVYVLDDCSMDETVKTAIQYEDKHGKLVILRNRTNRRYGGNQKLGYQYALDRGLDAVIMLHADGQYAPEYLPRIFAPLVDGTADAVFGSRMINRSDALRGGMPRYKFVGNIVLTGIENFLAGMHLSEFHSGYRGYTCGLLRRIPFWACSDEWHFDSHILFQTKAADARITEIPIPTHYGDEKCHVNGVVYGINCILSALGFWLQRKGVIYSRKYDVARTGSKYGEKFDDPMSSHSIIWNRLRAEPLSGASVLELGVGDAAVTRKLHEAGAITDGVEIDRSAADAARPYCRAIHVGDLNRIDDLGLRREYSIVLAADVLEHLSNPDYVLSRLKTLLHKDGLLVVSLPNIANLYVRLNLLLGRFPTHSKGLLDETHLHCYTLASMRRLLVRTGWVIESSKVTSIPLAIVFPFLRRAPWRWGMGGLFAATKMAKGLLAYQGVFFCRNPNEPHLL